MTVILLPKDDSHVLPKKRLLSFYGRATRARKGGMPPGVSVLKEIEKKDATYFWEGRSLGKLGRDDMPFLKTYRGDDRGHFPSIMTFQVSPRWKLERLLLAPSLIEQNPFRLPPDTARGAGETLLAWARDFQGVGRIARLWRTDGTTTPCDFPAHRQALISYAGPLMELDHFHLGFRILNGLEKGDEIPFLTLGLGRSQSSKEEECLNLSLAVSAAPQRSALFLYWRTLGQKGDLKDTIRIQIRTKDGSPGDFAIVTFEGNPADRTPGLPLKSLERRQDGEQVLFYAPRESKEPFDAAIIRAFGATIAADFKAAWDLFGDPIGGT